MEADYGLFNLCCVILNNDARCKHRFTKLIEGRWFCGVHRKHFHLHPNEATFKISDEEREDVNYKYNNKRKFRRVNESSCNTKYFSSEDSDNGSSLEDFIDDSYDGDDLSHSSEESNGTSGSSSEESNDTSDYEDGECLKRKVAFDDDNSPKKPKLERSGAYMDLTKLERSGAYIDLTI
jgi:hypothetical protein